ncbi:MAG: putative surface protein with fasciclin (FAS1) repeats, partial [Maribacter sp.]
MKNIVEIASENTDFSTLVAAVVAAGLADTLSGDG